MKQLWWIKKKHQLIAAATPCFVYDEETLISTFDELKTTLTAADRINYAMKANAAAPVLSLLYQKGACFDCVSIEEIHHVFSCCKGIAPQQIIFTPNFITKNEYQKAIDLDVIITIDNLHPLLHYGHIFHKKNIFIRIDPEISDGHHPYVKTGGSASKFGLSKEDLPQIKALVEKHGICVIGLHAHGGSGIKDPQFWSKIAAFLAEQRQFFPDATIFDLGGGFAASQTLDDQGVDLALVNQSLNAFKARFANLKLWIEPGRYLVCEGGVLLAQVTQIKQKAQRYFVGLETGMNSFIRQPLYGGYHPIVNLSRFDEPAAWTADIVGPICESADVLGYERLIPVSKEGDTFCMSHAGAYGASMASHYNLRKPAKEFFLSKDNIFYEIPSISHT